jgi:transcriptional regulator with XRE-family HTH domain
MTDTDDTETSPPSGAAAELSAEIRRLRGEAKLSQKELAAEVGYTRQYLSLAERTGGNLPSQGLIRALDTRLNADGRLLALREEARHEQRTRRAPRVEHDREALPVDRSEFVGVTLGLTGAMITPLAQTLLTRQPSPVPSVVGQVHIDQVRTVADLFRTWDHTYGGGLIREAVTAQLNHSVELLNARCPEKLRGELFSAVGLLGHTSAFMAFDAYAHDDARRMFRFALACAEQSGDWHLRAKVLSSMARQEIWCGDPDTGLTLVELAMVRADRLTPTERAMLLTARARALAKLQRVTDATATVDLADQQFHNAAQDEDPEWMAYYDAAQHSGDTGHALFDVAMAGQFSTEAAQRLRAAVHGHAATYARSRAIAGIKLASLTMVTGDPDEAVVIGRQALADVGAVTSQRAADDLRELRQMAAKHRMRTDVADLRFAIGERLAIAT